MPGSNLHLWQEIIIDTAKTCGQITYIGRPNYILLSYYKTSNTSRT